MARLMALCSLPRTNPGDRLQYKRVNGPYKLIIIAGGDNKLPFGNLPRLLLAWVSTEAVRTQSRDLVLGASLSEFMRKLGISSDSGGSRGERTRLRNQMDRLFNAHISLIYEDERGKATMNSQIADRTELWWNPKRPDAPVLWESKIELGEKFFQEIIRCPVPLDMNILKALKRCSLGLDIYLWLTYRTFALKWPLRLSWRQMYRQFGVDPARHAVCAPRAGSPVLGEHAQDSGRYPTGSGHSQVKSVRRIGLSFPTFAKFSEAYFSSTLCCGGANDFVRWEAATGDQSPRLLAAV